MLEFICGVAVGAAFSPFWMTVWNFIKAYIPFLKPPAPPAA